jgi:hypothetical protein
MPKFHISEKKIKRYPGGINIRSPCPTNKEAKACKAKPYLRLESPFHWLT